MQRREISIMVALSNKINTGQTNCKNVVVTIVLKEVLEQLDVVNYSSHIKLEKKHFTNKNAIAF